MKILVSHSGKIRVYIVFGLFLITLAVSALSITLSGLRKEAILTQRHIATLHAQTFEENFSQLLQQVEHMMDSVPVLSLQSSDEESILSIFYEMLQRTVFLRSLSLADENGKIIISSSKQNLGVVVDKKLFLPVPFGDVPLLRLGVPYHGRDFNDAKPSSINDPIYKDEIHFLPLLKKEYIDTKAYYIIASVNLDYLIHTYLDSLPQSRGSLQIYRSDATLLFSTKADDLLGSLYEDLLRNPSETIFAIRESRYLPISVKVVIYEDDALSYWDQERSKVMFTIVALIGFIALLSFALIVKYYREAQRQIKQLAYEKQFRIAMEATQTGLWIWNIKTGEATWDKQCYLLLGYKPDEFVPSYEKILELTHPEDAQDMVEGVKKQIMQNDGFIFERRMKSAYGKWIWVQVRGKVIEHTSDNEPSILTGVYINIDAQKKAENLHLTAVAFEAQEAIVITDANEKIIKVNEAFTRITGYEQSDVLGQTPRIFASGEHDKEFFEQMWKSLKKDGFWRGELWNRRKDGEMYAEFLTITTIRNELGEVSHYLANFNDITNHKMVQNNIKKLAYYDPLTLLANRRLLFSSLEKALQRAQQDKLYGAIIFIDLDYFKELNDTYGHDAGDMVLVQLGSRLLDATRQSDTVARLGGDEFVVLVENLGEEEDIAMNLVKNISSKILSRLNEPYSLTKGNYLLGASIGYTLFSFKDNKDATQILKEADTAMYEGKKRGRNRVVSFDTINQKNK